MKKIGVLLINLGTPQSTQVADVQSYLKEFLSDPDIINLPFLLRWLLVNTIIVPRRAQKSAEAYRQIWTENGSPLLIHTQNLTKKLQTHLASRHPLALSPRESSTSENLTAFEYHVRFAMRYGQPSIGQVLSEWLPEVDHLIVIPLYPQYAEATTGSISKEIQRQWARLHLPNKGIHIVKSFFSDPGFIQASRQRMQSSLQGKSVDHYLFSFHGLPERQIVKADRGHGHCLRMDDCCTQLGPKNQDCYRAQCFATSQLLAQSLGLKNHEWSLSFQSRLGRAKWIEPYTEETLKALAKAGNHRLAVMCPGFVSDCLETLEEMGLRMRQSFFSAGGRAFHLIPCLNSDEAWVAALAQLVHDETKNNFDS